MSQNFQNSLNSLHASNPCVNWPIVIADMPSLCHLLESNPGVEDNSTLATLVAALDTSIEMMEQKEAQPLVDLATNDLVRQAGASLARLSRESLHPVGLDHDV